MASRIRETDRFLMERGQKNYYITGEDIRDYVPPFLPGTKCIFYQSRAPLEWTRITSVNQATVKIVHQDVHINGTSAGGRTGGSLDFTSCFASNRGVPVPQHNHGFSEGTHSHGVSERGHSHGANYATNHSHSSGGGGGHFHTAYDSPNIDPVPGKGWWHKGKSENNAQSTETASSAASLLGSTSGVSVGNGTATVSISGKKVGIGTSNPVDSGGSDSPVLNMQLKYRDAIICSKDPF